MKLTLFGATGEAGIMLIDKALAAGHDVTAYARNPSKLAGKSSILRIVSGELSNAAAITKAIEEQDAVVSLLGPKPGAKGRPLGAGMSVIANAMQATGVRRLIATSTPSSPDPADRSALSFRLAVRLIRALQPDGYADIVASAEVVRSSQLDWTLVRLPMLTSKDGSAPPAVGYVGSPGLRLFWLSRNVLADFVLSQLNDRTWLCKAPLISNQK